MINYFKKYKVASFIALLACTFLGCSKDDYFIDGGKSNGEFKGSMLDLLKSKPGPLDTIAAIVELSGLKETFEKDTFTFFAPTDLSIKQTILILNREFLFPLGKDTVKKLDDISPALWKKYLTRYMMKGTNRLKDYPQVDFDIRSVYPGLNTYNYSGADLFNVGGVFNDQNKVRYIGYRQLAYSYVPDPSKPLDNWVTAAVSTSDLKPNNGIVHVLAFTSLSTSSTIGALPASTRADYFGFGFDFMSDVEQSK